MKNLLILRFLDLFKFFFIKAGYDYDSIRLILQMKFAISYRKPLAIVTKSKKAGNNRSYEMFFYLFFGIILGVMVIPISYKSLFLSLILFFTISMIFVLLSLFNELSISFFDLTDSELLLSTPIKPLDLNIAKNLHIFLFFMQITLIFSLPSLILYGVFYGIFTSLSIFVTLIFGVVFLIAITSILYGLFLWKFSGEKLKDYITYLQIAVVAMSFVTYWFFVSGINSFLDKLDLITNSPVLYFFPPAWFAAPTAILFIHKRLYFFLSLLGILSSLLSYYIYIKFIAPYFETNLFKIKKSEKISIKKKHNIFSKLFAKFDFAPFFDFSNSILSSDRKLKLTIYPTMAMIFIFSIILPISYFRGENISAKKYYFLLYIVIELSVQIFAIISHSEYFKAAWVFRYLPMKTPENLFKGAILATFIKFQLSIFLLVSIFYLWIWKFPLIPFVIVTFLNGLIVILLFLMMSERILPFSQELKGQNALASRGWAYFLSSLVFVPLTAGIHYIFSLFGKGEFILMAIQIILIIIFWKNYFGKLTWNDLKSYL